MNGMRVRTESQGVPRVHGRFLVILGKIFKHINHVVSTVEVFHILYPLVYHPQVKVVSERVTMRVVTHSVTCRDEERHDVILQIRCCVADPTNE